MQACVNRGLCVLSAFSCVPGQIRGPVLVSVLL